MLLTAEDRTSSRIYVSSCLLLRMFCLSKLLIRQQVSGDSWYDSGRGNGKHTSCSMMRKCAFPKAGKPRFLFP